MPTQITRVAMITLASLIFLGGCASSKVNLKPVVVSQANDNQMNCNQLEFAIDALEHDVADVVQAKIKREQRTFAAGAIGDLTLSLLSQGKNGASAPIHSGIYAGFEPAEQARLESVIQRHNHLLLIAKEKQCGFAPHVESQLDKSFQNPRKPQSGSDARQRLRTD